MKYDSIMKETGVITSHAGARAYSMSHEMELYTAVVTSSLCSQFYEQPAERVRRIAYLVEKVEPEFVARLAVYARSEMHLRSIPLLLLVELARVHHGDDLVARTVERTVQRADEIMELLTCYQWRQTEEGRGMSDAKGRKKLGRLSHQIQKGLRRAFCHFDEYQFAKYDRDGLTVSLRDALFLVRPKARDEQQQALFDKIASRQLATPYTWETELSELGKHKFPTAEQRQMAVREKWEELVGSGRLGYMAMLRSLRGMLQAGISDSAIETVCQTIADARQVAKAKQLPFRYLAAYREVGSHAPVLEALETAALHAAEHIEGYGHDTRVLIASDVSGSMWHPISGRSTVEYYDIGLMLSMMLRYRCEQVVTGIFGDVWKAVDLPDKDILASTQKLRKMEGKVGYSTCGYKVIDWLIERRMVMDKVMMFTDLQMWDSTMEGHHIEDSWKRYKDMVPSARLYLFDLAGHGQAPLRMEEPDVCLIAGWSDRIFDVLAAVERGATALDVIKISPLLL